MDATLQNLHVRLTQAENTIHALNAQVQRLQSGGLQGIQSPRSAPQLIPQVASHTSQGPSAFPSLSLTQGQGLQTSIPLAARRAYTPRVTGPQGVRPFVQTMPEQALPGEAPLPPMALSEILHVGELVTFGIFTGRDALGSLQTSTAVAKFDGTDLTVLECATVPALVGLKTSKAGEILFKFMNGLKEAGRIERPFNALPWRLASVIREGQKVTLAQLRAAKA